MKMVKLGRINGLRYFGKNVTITTIIAYTYDMFPADSKRITSPTQILDERFQRFVIFCGLNERRDRADVIPYNRDAIFDTATQLGFSVQSRGNSSFMQVNRNARSIE